MTTRLRGRLFRSTPQPRPVAARAGFPGKRQLVHLAIGALAVSCSDGITEPPDARMRSDAWPGPIVVMTRTVDVAEVDGAAAIHRTIIDTLGVQVRKALGAASARPADSNDVMSMKVGFDVAKLPRPTVMLPARRESAMCTDLPRWAETRSGDSKSERLELAGVGDAPASSIRVLRDGKLISTVERTWVRTAISWQLQRQVTKSADGRFSDVVTYEHHPAGGQLASNAIPLKQCPPSQRSMLASPAEESGRYYAQSSTSLFQGGFADYCGGRADPCYDKELAVYRADIALVVAATGLTVGCLPPAAVFAGPCAVAVTAYAAAVANLRLAVLDLERCRANPPPLNQPDEPAWFVAPEARDSTSGNPVATGVPETSPMSCDSRGWGGEGGGSPQPNCSWEIWEISYDNGETWQYLGTFWTCYER